MKRNAGVKVRCPNCNTLEHWSATVSTERKAFADLGCGHKIPLTFAIDQLQMMRGYVPEGSAQMRNAGELS